MISLLKKKKNTFLWVEVGELVGATGQWQGDLLQVGSKHTRSREIAGSRL